jgi:hypothetical protein
MQVAGPGAPANAIVGSIAHRLIENDIIAKQAAAGDRNWHAERTWGGESVIDLTRTTADVFDTFEIKPDKCSVGRCYSAAVTKLREATQRIEATVGNQEKYSLFGQVQYEGFNIRYEPDSRPGTGMIFYSIDNKANLVDRLWEALRGGWRPGSYKQPATLPGPPPVPAYP